MGRDVGAGCTHEEAGGAISGFGAALEIVDLPASPDDPEGIVAENVFHRAFSLGHLRGAAPREELEGRMVINGAIRASKSVSTDFAEPVRTVARLLGAMNERLRAGDCLITGSVVQLPVEPGDEVLADLGYLGEASLAIAP